MSVSDTAPCGNCPRKGPHQIKPSRCFASCRSVTNFAGDAFFEVCSTAQALSRFGEGGRLLVGDRTEERPVIPLNYRNGWNLVSFREWTKRNCRHGEDTPAWPFTRARFLVPFSGPRLRRNPFCDRLVDSSSDDDEDESDELEDVSERRA